MIEVAPNAYAVIQANGATNSGFIVGEEGVLYAGDIAFHQVLPAFPDGHITKWLDVMEETAKIEVDTIVPGHGPVGDKAQFAESKELMAHLHGEIRRAYDPGLSEEEAAKQVNLGQDRVGLITHMAYLAYKGELQ